MKGRETEGTCFFDQSEVGEGFETVSAVFTYLYLITDFSVFFPSFAIMAGSLYQIIEVTVDLLFLASAADEAIIVNSISCRFDRYSMVNFSY